MGAPKQKWTAEEEAALKAGVRKHGTGKWRTILTDPEFSAVLRLRSNVDLKDKWRNINVTAIWGSRQKAKLALKRNPQTSKRDENSKALRAVLQSNEEVVDAKPLAVSIGTPRNSVSKELLARGRSRSSLLSSLMTWENGNYVDVNVIWKIRAWTKYGSKNKTLSAYYAEDAVLEDARMMEQNVGEMLDNLIMEAITALKEPSGSDRGSIALYIEGKYSTTPNLRKLLVGKLKLLAANGKLIKVKHKYMIAPNLPISEGKRNSPLLLLEGNKKDSPKLDKNNMKMLTKSQVDQELSKIKGMTALEAAAAAAKAVAEAEAAIAEAEEAAREAEAAEAEAEAAQVFAKAAIKAFKYRLRHAW